MRYTETMKSDIREIIDVTALAAVLTTLLYWTLAL